MPIQPLSPDLTRRQCDSTQFSFATTADLTPVNTIIGQPRGTRAIAFGVDMKSEGYNIYVTGARGTGRETAIQHYLQSYAQEQASPKDWVYVNNFQTPHKPHAISLPTGEGKQLQAQMAQLLQNMQQTLPPAFQSDAYRSAMRQLEKELAQTQEVLFQEIQMQASKHGLHLVQTPNGLMVTKVDENGRSIPSSQLTPEQQQAQETLNHQLEATVLKAQTLEQEKHEQMNQLDRQVAEQAIARYFAPLTQTYAQHPQLTTYLANVRQDILSHIHEFMPREENQPEADLRRYTVNVLVTSEPNTGKPVVVEHNPTYHNLVGRIEYEMRGGIVSTHFTNIKGGSLHRANGGYLIINAYELLEDFNAWEALRRILLAKEIYIQPLATMDGSQVLAKSLDPEPVPLDIKIILVGSTALYFSLYEMEDDFRTLFKVRADFSLEMDYDPEHIQDYAQFVATLCHEEELNHFNADAVAKIVEYGCYLADHQHKLSTQFGLVADLVREASYWASKAGREIVSVADVQTAVKERTYRVNRLEEQIRQQVIDETVFIQTDGKKVGQINGLSVFDYGDHAFGQASRVTVHTYMGSDGITHIERETDMSGPLHQKGLLSFTGYLGGKYGRRQPLSYKASITFEQNYGPIDGDSASSTELYALLSSLGELPIKQGIAVTGSVNQWGDIQPIGGVNQKVEGFYHLCASRGLTGEQGVLIPYANRHNLMLSEDVQTAVAQQQFHIWAVRTIDEGIELLTGLPAGIANEMGEFPENTVHGRVQQRLRKLAEDLNAFGNESRDDEEE